MSHWDSCDAIERHPDKVSGAWIFKNTRLPVASLFDAFKDSPTIDEFIDDFAAVTREQIEALLDHEIQSLEKHFTDEDTNDMTQHFLIEHDRHWKIPTRITIYDDLDQANGQLDTLENEQMAELSACLKAGRPVRMEYVVLGAASLATIKRTHGRYFGGDYEVVASVESSGSAARGRRSQQTPKENRSVEAKAFADALTTP